MMVSAQYTTSPPGQLPPGNCRGKKKKEEGREGGKEGFIVVGVSQVAVLSYIFLPDSLIARKNTNGRR